jgi:hypothetical protein
MLQTQQAIPGVALSSDSNAMIPDGIAPTRRLLKVGHKLLIRATAVLGGMNAASPASNPGMICGIAS